MTPDLAILIAFAILQVGDAFSTLRFLKHGIKEANPVMVWLFDALDPLPALVITKVLIIVAAHGSMGAPYWTEAMLALCAFYAFIVVRNWRVVK